MKVSLSDGEWKLMYKLWEEPSRTIAQLTAALQPETGWSKQGAVSHDGGTPRHYSATLAKEDAARAETRSFLDKVYGGRLGLMMSAMVDSRSLTQQDIDELAAILEKAKEGN